MQHDIIVDCSFRYPPKLFLFLYSGPERKQIYFFLPIFTNIFFLIATIIITASFNIYFSRITLLVATWSFLLGCAPNFINAPLIYCWHWVKFSQLLPSSVMFQNISQTFDTRGAREINFNMFQFEKHYFQFCVRNSNSK